MPVTTLNKTIALFIVGGAPIAWLILRNLPWLIENASSFKDFDAIGAVLFAFILIPVTAILGTVIEGLAGLLRYYWIKPTVANAKVARRLLATNEFGGLQEWIEELRKLHDTRYPESHFRDSAEGRRNEGITPLTYAAGVFLSKASKEHQDWHSAHFSSYTMASSLSCVLPTLGILDVMFFNHACLCDALLELFLVCVATYLMMTFAARMYMYSYRMACRFAIDELRAERPAPSSP